MHHSHPGYAMWLDRLEIEHGNIRSALNWCVPKTDVEQDSKLEMGLWLAGTLSQFWALRGYISEGRQHLIRAIALIRGHGGIVKADLADALAGAARLAHMQGNYSEAQTQFEESLAVARELNDKQRIAVSLNNLGNNTLAQNELKLARLYFEESLAVIRESGNNQSIAASLNNLGSIASHQGDYSMARTRFEESLALELESGNKYGIANSLINLGGLP